MGIENDRKLVVNCLPLTEAERAQFTRAAKGMPQEFVGDPAQRGSMNWTAEIPDELKAYATAVIGNITPETCAQCPRLEWLQTWSAGVDKYQRPGVLHPGSMLTNATGAYGQSVSEHMFAMMWSIMKNLHIYAVGNPNAAWQDAGRVISPDGKTTLRVRLIDSVGYMIPGAVGDTEDGKPRMVTTPWASEELPMAQAAELGTKKVMEDHSSIGVVVTTDGTVTDIPREDYREAEARAIADMQKTGKPFVVVVNTQDAKKGQADAICARIRAEYGVQALTMDCAVMQTQDIARLLEAVMYAFPVEELRFFLPSWVRALPDDHPVKAALYDAMLDRASRLTSLSEAESVMGSLRELDPVDAFRVREVDLGTGTVTCELHLPETLFYEELSKQAGVEIADDEALMQMLRELSQTKKLYEKVQTALEQVKATGYGIVMPDAEELKLEKPEIVKKNGNYAVKLRASAPSIHMMRAQIETEISPMVGGEQESQQLIDYLLGEYEEDTDKLWQSNIFGKSLYELVSEGVTAKIMRMPDDARQKLTKTLGRMINENTGGMICILL